MRIFILSRHGESQLNVAGLVNGDPARDRGLTPLGEQQAAELGLQIAALEIEVTVTSRFPCAQATARLALSGRDVPFVVDAGLDDVRVGELEGRTIAEYREWKSHNPRNQPFPGGETLDDAALRFAASFKLLLERHEAVTLVVCHEIPVRYAMNAATGSDTLDRPLHDVPNARPYLFDESGLSAAVARIDALVGR